jgi:hypothetical protein
MPQQNNFDADQMLAFFQQLGKEVDNLKLKISSLNDAGSKGGSNLADEFERFGKVVEHYTRGPIKAMDAAAAGIAKTLLGAGGLAVGFAGVAKALDAFAVGELQLRNFATNTGFTVQSVQNLRTQLSAAGVDASEASSGIASIGSKLQEVLALQETSSFYKSLQASSPALAEQVRQLMNAGKQQEALNVLQQAYNNGGERFKAWLPTVTGLSRAAFEAGKVGMEGLIEPWKFQEGEAAKYHKTMTNLETIGTSLWTDMAYTMIEGINKMMGKEGIDGLNEKAHEFADNFRTFFNTYVMPALATTKQEFDWVVKAFGEVDAFLTKWTGKKKEGEQKDEKDKTLPLGSIRTERAIIDSMNSQLPGGPEGGKAGGLWDWIGKQFSMEAGAAEVEPGSSLLVQETVETDKDSNKLLRDMRDTFQKWDQKEGSGSGSGAFGAGGVPGTGVGPGAATGGPAGGMGRSGPGSGQSFPQSKGGGGPAETTGDLGDSGPSGTLAEQRAGFKKELEGDPKLKRFAIDAMQHEGGIQSNMEQLFNMAAMRHQTIRQALFSGQYGPVKHGIISGNISAKIAAEGEAALAKVYAGSNITDYATDQGMRGDPNFAKYMANQKYWGMHKVEGAWFSAHGEAGRRWAERQRAADAAAGTGVWSGSGKAIPFLPGGVAFNDRFGNPRAAIDNALRHASGSNTGTATVDINFGDKDKPGSVWEKGASPFIATNIKRSPQAAVAGGGVTAFNTYSFE